MDSRISQNRTPIFVYGRLEKNGKIKLTREMIPKSSLLMIVPSFSVWNGPMNPTFVNHFSQSIELFLKTNPTAKGFVLDAEFGANQTKHSYTDFVCSIHKLIKTKDSHLQFHLTLFPPNHPDQHDYYNWDELYLCSDAWFIMFYDEHNPRTKSGPVSTSNWIESNLVAIERKLLQENGTYTVSIASIRKKFFLGLPLYGYGKNKAGKFGKVIPLKMFTESKEFQTSFEDFLKINTKKDEIYLPTKYFLHHWKKESRRLGYGGVAYWREEFLGNQKLQND